MMPLMSMAVISTPGISSWRNTKFTREIKPRKISLTRVP